MELQSKQQKAWKHNHKKQENKTCGYKRKHVKFLKLLKAFKITFLCHVFHGGSTEQSQPSAK